MLKETNEIDLIFWVENHLQCPIKMFVESGEWEDPQALEWLEKKIQHYQQQIISGALKKKPRYKNRIFKFVDLYSVDPIPKEAVEILEKKKAELADLGISFSYRYAPDLDG